VYAHFLGMNINDRPSEQHLKNGSNGRPFAETDLNARSARLLNWGAAVLVIIILAATGAILATMRERAVSEASRQLKSLSLVLADQLDRNFQSIELVEQALIEEIDRHRFSTPDEFRARMSTEAVHMMLSQRIAAFPHISGLSLRDLGGGIVNASLNWPNSRGRLEPNPADMLAAEPGRAIVGPPFKSPVSGQWAIYLAKMVMSPSFEPVGVVLGTMKLQSFEDYFAKVRPSSGSAIALFRSDGALIARYPSQPDLVGRKFSQESLGPGALTSDFIEFRLESPIDGQERLVAARRLPHYPISVMMTTTLDEALAEWHTTALYLVGTSTSIAIAIAIIVFLCRRQFLGRMRIQNVQMTAALDNISQGLIMLDSDGRVVVCNRRYSELYLLPPQLSAPGTDLRDILRWRKSRGTFSGDPEDQVAHLVARTGIQVDARDFPTGDGRAISIVSASMEGGGWVATHEDITERSKKEASFRLLFENNPVPMWVFDETTLEFIAVNQAAVDKYGYSRKEFAGLKVTDVRPSGARQEFVEWAATIPRVDRASRTWQHQAADGQVMDVSVYSQSLEYEGRTARLVAVHDVTEQKKATEELAKTRTFLDAVIENVPLPIIVKDVPRGATTVDGCTLALVNKAAEKLYGIVSSECMGKTLAEVFPEAAIQVGLRLDAEAIKSDCPVVSEDRLAFGGSRGIRVLTSKRLAIRNEAGEPEHLLALFEDVTERRKNEQRIAYMAHHDVLTGLANRAAFDECFAATLEHARIAGSRVSLLCIDLDGFKEINDTYGHSAGDAVLREVAKRLELTAEGAFIARFGGDEFALIVSDDKRMTSSEIVAGRILAMMRTEIAVAEQRLTIGATIGIAQYPAHGADCESLLRNADVALYRAKGADAGTVQIFTPEMGTDVRDRRILQEDLRHAVVAGEMLLHYQPQFQADGSVIGFEALARWNSPKRGMVSPAVFIEVAEDSGLIQALGEWVLREACREAAGWPQPLKISVNVSPRQFRHGDLASLVHTVLLETGLAPSRLELEITEGVLIGDFSRALSILNRLKALGVDIALDDFGTGYSSLSYLHAFPFDLIKIDRAFVSDVGTNRHSSAIVRAVIGLGRSLGVPVLAEGVETEEQRSFLFDEGCHAVQGYLTGRPASAETYASLLRTDADRRPKACAYLG
jgi:diguanylate cyclase (GGDEF)-like protein/PAS domain S-box-containing protein